jgi:hypothetical protein
LTEKKWWRMTGFRVNLLVAVHGLKLEIGNWEEQYKSMKAKFPISMFREHLHIKKGEVK